MQTQYIWSMLRILHFTSISLMAFATLGGLVTVYFHYQFHILLTFGDKFTSTHSIAYVKTLVAIENSLDMRNNFLFLGSVCLVLSVVSIYWRGLALINKSEIY